MAREKNNDRFLVDPPSGYLYGFPKEFYPGEWGEDITQFCVANGYPQKEIDEMGDAFYVTITNLN